MFQSGKLSAFNGWNIKNLFVSPARYRILKPEKRLSLSGIVSNIRINSLPSLIKTSPSRGQQKRAPTKDGKKFLNL